MREKTDVSFGGQAVIEGVMMKSPNFYSIATLKNEKIKVKLKKTSALSKKRFSNLFFIRGITSLYEMLVLGMDALTYSANESAEDDGKLSKKEIIFSLLISFAFAILIFIWLPLWLTKFIVSGKKILFDVVDGLIRVFFFFLYMYVMQFSKDLRRVFEFHGAEHATINAYEHSKKLIVKNVKKFTTFHPRCGTSFILIVLIVSIVIFSFIRSESLLIKFLGRILFLPVIAGLSYELLKFTSKTKGILFKITTSPGRLIQKITTKKPDDLQIKTAIKALEAVLKAEAKLNKKLKIK